MTRTALLLIGLLPAIALADIQCKAVGITDGDTLTCVTAEKAQIKVRLAEIDTPEKKQPYGEKAKQALAGMVHGKQVTLAVQAKDRYGRTVARVHQGNLDVNLEMVSQGAAWVYRKYSEDRTMLVVEAEARQARRGLWALPEAQRLEPWEWRRR